MDQVVEALLEAVEASTPSCLDHLLAYVRHIIVPYVLGDKTLKEAAADTSDEYRSVYRYNRMFLCILSAASQKKVCSSFLLTRIAAGARLEAVALPLWRSVVDLRCRSQQVSAFVIALFNPGLLAVPFLNEPDDAPLRALFRTIVSHAGETRKHIVIKLVSRCIR